MQADITGIALNVAQLGVSSTVLIVLLDQHKVWVRLKDRVNSLWSDRCEEKGERYVPLDNGKS
jgi:hypothetical protein